MKLYLFGPMTGKPGWNFPAFDEARERLKNLGHVVFCPASLTRALPYGERERKGREYHQQVMTQDIACIYASEGLVGLPGWEGSRGSTVEVSLALYLQLPIFCAVSLRELEIIEVPWYGRYRDCPPYVKPGGMSLDPYSISNHLTPSTEPRGHYPGVGPSY